MPIVLFYLELAINADLALQKTKNIAPHVPKAPKLG